MPPPFDPTSGAPLRFGVIGVGERGSSYARALAGGDVLGATLEAVCDVRDAALEPFERFRRFASARALVENATLDAVVVATPHRSHEEPTRLALSAGLHVLTEKPLDVHMSGAERMIGEYSRRSRLSQLFATALVLRADARYVKLRGMLRSGELGRVQRIAWTVTDCLRSEAYFKSAEWRGSFQGEGGGLLVNQCSHQLDLWQWLFGMPDRVRSFLGFGRFHAIEVEDQVTAYVEYDAAKSPEGDSSGATGVFVASTGEAPGTNRLEVASELGRIVIEGETFEIWRNAIPTPERIRTAGARSPAPAPSHERLVLPVGGVNTKGLLENLVRAVAGDESLIAPADEGVHSIELANALLLSSLEGRMVELPLEREYRPRVLDAVRPS